MPKWTKPNASKSYHLLSFYIVLSPLHASSHFIPKQLSEEDNKINSISQTKWGFERLNNLDFWYGTAWFKSIFGQINS